MSAVDDLIADLDLALAALRRVIVRAISTGITAPTHVVETPSPKSVSPSPTLKRDRAAPASPPSASVSHNGITISFDPPRIEWRRGSQDLVTRHAQFLAALLPGSPQPIDRRNIIGKLWAVGHAPASADGQLSTMAVDLRALLRPIGLNVNVVRGVGIALQPMDGP